MLKNKDVQETINTLIEEGIYDLNCAGVIIDHKRVNKDMTENDMGDYIMGIVYSRSIPSKNGELIKTSRVMNIIEYGRHKKALTENLITGTPNTYILYNEE